MKRSGRAVVVAVFLLAAPAFGTGHPGSESDCVTCHSESRGDAAAPKVVPARPGIVARLFGQAWLRGHPSLGCAGSVKPDGTLTGCHSPETGKRAFLVLDLTGKPADTFCRRCHAEQGRTDSHHPSYKRDTNGDGIPDALVRPAASQEVFGIYSSSSKPEPVRSHPDALSYAVQPDGSSKREVALPLQTVLESVGGKEVSEEGVMTCISCHNPHYGYRVDGEAPEGALAKTARGRGDALLRLRDYDNTLCDACH